MSNKWKAMTFKQQHVYQKIPWPGTCHNCYPLWLFEGTCESCLDRHIPALPPYELEDGDRWDRRWDNCEQDKV